MLGETAVPQDSSTPAVERNPRAQGSGKGGRAAAAAAGINSARSSAGAGGSRYSINDAPLAVLRGCGLSDELARAVVSARKEQPFVSVGDCVSRIRKLGRTKLLKLEAQNISIPRQPPGRKPSKPEVGSAAQPPAKAKGQKRKRAAK